METLVTVLALFLAVIALYAMVWVSKRIRQESEEEYAARWEQHQRTQRVVVVEVRCKCHEGPPST